MDKAFVLGYTRHAQVGEVTPSNSVSLLEQDLASNEFGLLSSVYRDSLDSTFSFSLDGYLTDDDTISLQYDGDMFSFEGSEGFPALQITTSVFFSLSNRLDVLGTVPPDDILFRNGGN